MDVVWEKKDGTVRRVNGKQHCTTHFLMKCKLERISW
jgi:hypothetical protein